MSVIRSTWQLIKFKPFLVFLGFLSDVFYFIAPLITSLIVREIFNDLSGVYSIKLNLWVLVLVILPLSLALTHLMDFIFIITMFPFVLQAQILIRKNMLELIYDHPGADAITDTPGEAVSRFRGDAREVSWFAYEVTQKLSISIFAISSFVVMQHINWKITLYISFPLTVMLFLIYITRKKITVYRRNRRKAAGEVTRTIAEIFKSIQAIKTATAEHHILQHFDALNQKRKKAEVIDEFFSETIRAIYRITVSLGTGIILIIVAQSMQNNLFTVGDLSFFVMIMGSLGDFIWDLGDFVPRYLRTKVSYQRMWKLIYHPAVPVSKEKLVEHGKIYIKEQYQQPKNKRLVENEEKLQTLSVKGLSCVFAYSDRGIHDISFSIKRGTFTVITGRIGSGKTTLIRCLLGLYPKESGKVLWNGKEIGDMSKFFVPPYSAYTSQVPTLFSDKIKENILLGLTEEEAEIDNALYLAVVEKDIKRFSKGLDTLVGPKGVKLSGGQKQRIAAARMFARKSELYVFDDLSSALDVETETLLWKRIFENKNMTCLVVSNRKIALKKADQIIVMKDGKIESIGKLDELLQNSEELKKIWSQQEERKR